MRAVVIGLITLAVMGIVGTLLPLSFGVIMDYSGR